jgi:Flp pilus assembly protein TadD
MSSPYSNKHAGDLSPAAAMGELSPTAARVCALAAAAVPALRARLAAGVVACACILLVACSSTPSEPAPEDSKVTPASVPSDSSTNSKTTPPNAAGGAQSGASLSPAPTDIPKRAQADFDRAVSMMKSGNATEAELEFGQLTAAYPKLASPKINLGLLQRKGGRLEDAQATLRSAVDADPSNVVGWNELGVTLRMRGKFTEAVDAYEHALAVDPNFAPAHRNLAVVLDLYLGDAERALTELERYKELTGEEKPVNGWIAELRQRTGKPAAPRPAAPKPAEGATPPAEGSGEAPPPAQPAEAQPPGAGATPPPKAGEL